MMNPDELCEHCYEHFSACTCIQGHIDEWNKRAKGYGSLRLRSGNDVEVLPERHITPLKYACPICEKLYDTEYQAMRCRDTRYNDAGLVLGDILIIPGECAYEPPAKGQEHWCAFTIESSPGSSSHFEHNKQWFPYYVVTAIHTEQRDRHRCVVTVMSLFGDELSGGWNPANGDGHEAMFHPGRSKAMQRSGAYSTWWTSKRHGKTMGSRFISAKPGTKLLKDAQDMSGVGISSHSLL